MFTCATETKMSVPHSFDGRSVGTLILARHEGHKHSLPLMTRSFSLGLLPYPEGKPGRVMPGRVILGTADGCGVAPALCSPWYCR